jgi:hypothetical protein
LFAGSTLQDQSLAAPFLAGDDGSDLHAVDRTSNRRIVGLNGRLFTGSTLEDQFLEFANKIDKNNSLPSLHLATTSPRQPCGCHNCRATNLLSLSEVVCLSVIVKGERTSCNAQQLKSIDDYQKRVNDQGDAIGAVVQVFQDMEASRQTITSDLFSGKKATILFQVSK